MSLLSLVHLRKVHVTQVIDYPPSAASLFFLPSWSCFRVTRRSGAWEFSHRTVINLSQIWSLGVQT